MKAMLLALAAALAVGGCATTTSPTGRTQYVGAVSPAQLDQLGAQAFAEEKAKTPQSPDAKQVAYVRCVVSALTRELPSQWQSPGWETAVFVNKEPNAFALPGGKVGVYTGIFSVAKNQDQLAAVVGDDLGAVGRVRLGPRLDELLHRLEAGGDEAHAVPHAVTDASTSARKSEILSRPS